MYLGYILIVQASSVSCTTDCSAQPVRPKARCKPGSAFKRLLISTNPERQPTPYESVPQFLDGLYRTVFCAILTFCAIGSNTLSFLTFLPNAALKEA